VIARTTGRSQQKPRGRQPRMKRLRHSGLHLDVQPVSVPVDAPVADEPEVAVEAFAFADDEAIEPRRWTWRRPSASRTACRGVCSSHERSIRSWSDTVIAGKPVEMIRCPRAKKVAIDPELVQMRSRIATATASGFSTSRPAKLYATARPHERNHAEMLASSTISWEPCLATRSAACRRSRPRARCSSAYFTLHLINVRVNQCS
jgi:hypothetical protein